MTAFPIVDVALEGFRLTRERPGTVLAWGGVLAAAQALTAALLTVSGAGQGLAALAHTGAAPGADPAALPALLSGAAPGVLLSASVSVLGNTLVYAALLRAVLRPAEGRAAFLRVGLDELRLLGVVLALGLMGFVLSFVLVGALGMLILPLASAGGYPVSGVTPLVLALAVAVLSYPLVRLSLAPAATLAEHRARVIGSWPLTHGAFWPLMASALIAAALSTAVVVLAEVLIACLWALGSGEKLEAASRALQPDLTSMAGALSPGSIAAVLTGGVVTGFALVIAAAPGAAAYRVLAKRTA